MVDYAPTHLQDLLTLLYETARSSGFSASREKFKHDVIKHIDFTADIIRILEDDRGRVLGCYRCSRRPREAEYTDAAYLFDIAVHRDYRGRGYGRKLFDDMFHVLRRSGYRRLYSSSRRENEAAASLHAASGFDIVRESELWIEWQKLL
ncbi:MAG: GNAT family N-acetyltransferase [Spirochaetia bacterium]